MRNKQDQVKYGDIKSDVIADNYEQYGVGFICGNIQKLVTRIENIGRLPLLKMLFYKWILAKGGRSDFRKLSVYLSRLEQVDYQEYEWWIIYANNRLDA